MAKLLHAFALFVSLSHVDATALPQVDALGRFARRPEVAR